MSTKQAALDSEMFQSNEDESEDDFVCPLCGSSDVKKGGLPDHIASDECETEHKEVNYA